MRDRHGAPIKLAVSLTPADRQAGQGRTSQSPESDMVNVTIYSRLAR